MDSFEECTLREHRIDLAHPAPEALALATKILTQGGILAFPTDTVYGLTGDPRRGDSLLALQRLKRRSLDHRFPFVAADDSQAALLVSLLEPATRRLTQRFWPGPLTLVLPLTGRARLAPWEWGSSLAIRVPRAAVARELAREAGVPLPATSANLSGEPPAAQPTQISKEIRRGLDLILDGGTLPPSLSSTVLDLTGPIPRLLRPGPIPAESLSEVLGLSVALRPD